METSSIPTQPFDTSRQQVQPPEQQPGRPIANSPAPPHTTAEPLLSTRVHPNIFTTTGQCAWCYHNLGTGNERERQRHLFRKCREVRVKTQGNCTFPICFLCAHR